MNDFIFNSVIIKINSFNLLFKKNHLTYSYDDNIGEETDALLPQVSNNTNRPYSDKLQRILLSMHV